MAVTVVFAVSGFLMANWLARLPAVRDALQITPGRLGVILLSLSIGSLLALPLSGPVVHRLRPAPTVLGCAVASTTAMVLVGIGGSGGLGGVNTLVPALFVYGVGVGMWDVAMNVEGAEVEQLVGRAIMPWFHAGFSLGTVAGALTGAAAAAFDLALAVHLALAAGFSLLAIVVATRFFLPVPQGSSEDRSAGSGTLAAWREPRTILIGLMMLGMALAEGSANDWIALGLVDGYGLPHAAGAVGLGLFLTAMTSMRLAGPVVLARFGRVRVVRGGALLVLASLGVYVAGAELADPAAGLAAVNTLALLLAGAAVVGWGIGAALGFPIGISAASDTPARSAARGRGVPAIGSGAFLAGPPILGLVADRVGIVRSMLGVSLAVALTLICAGAARAVDPDGDLRR